MLSSRFITALAPTTLFILLANHPISTLSQVFIPNNLPTCAASCAQLQNAQSSCTPAGGAPVSSDATYQSCFCQSALLSTFYSSPGVQLCTQCSPADNQQIQTWYQGFCKAGASALQSGGASSAASQPASATAVAKATSSTNQVQNNPAQTAGATVSNSQSGTTTNTQNGPWFSTHWKWVVMLVVLIIGLTAFAIIFSIMHRRYHRRREQQWSQSTVPHPDINTWGPGQSVHDFGVYRAAGNLKRSLSRSLSRNKNNAVNMAEKGKSTPKAAQGDPTPPVPVVQKERYGTGFGARGPPPPQRDRSGRTGFGGMF